MSLIGKPTIQRAAIAWISTEQDLPLESFQSAFFDAGYRLSLADVKTRADMAVVDLRNGEASPEIVRRLTSRARQSAPYGGIIFLASHRTDAQRRAYLRRSGGLVVIEDDPAPLVHACRERLRRRNLAEEAGERIKSLTEAEALRVKSQTKSSDQMRVLLAGKPSPLTLSIMASMQEKGFVVESVLSPAQAVHAIKSQVFDCAIFLPAHPSDPLRALAAQCKQKRKHIDFPVFTVSKDKVTAEDRISAQFAERDLPDLASSAVTRARQMSVLRKIIAPSSHVDICDPYTQSTTASFFARHAARVKARSEETGRGLSIAAVQIYADAFHNASAKELAIPLKDASELISSITRTEDMLARIAPTTFAITLPATAPEDAMRVAGRIAGVLQNTMFKMAPQHDGQDQVFAVTAETSAHAVQNEQRLEETVAKLLGDIRNRQPEPRVSNNA